MIRWTVCVKIVLEKVASDQIDLGDFSFAIRLEKCDALTKAQLDLPMDRRNFANE